MDTYIISMIQKIESKELEFNALNDMITRNTPQLNERITEIYKQNGLTMEQVTELSKCPCASTSQEGGANKFGFGGSTSKKVNPDIEKLNTALYRQLILKCHPDKTLNVETADFIAIKQSFENQDSYSLIKYIKTYKLDDFNEINEDLMIIIVQKKHEELRSNIKKIKMSIGYKLLMEGNIDSFVVQIKQLIEMQKENEYYKKRNEELRQKLSEDR